MKTTADRKVKILLVEDDPNLSLVIQDYLEMIDYQVKLCKNGEEGLAEYHNANYDLVILDIMMPIKDGFSVAEDIRKKDDVIPIIFLTAKTLKEDRIKGFQVGCDDYIAKPFSTEELSLRIKAILKRCVVPPVIAENETPKIYNIGKFTFDHENMLLAAGEDEQSLTRKEAALLQLLCEHQNKLLTREVALKSIWGSDDYFIGRSMDVFITKLRKYLKDDPSISITNVHGMGFKFEVK